MVGQVAGPPPPSPVRIESRLALSSVHPKPSSPAARSTWLLVLVGLIWLGTMAQLARSELSRAEASPDVAALIDSARLRKLNATVHHDILFGVAEVGSVSSTVSGGQWEGQLLYALRGELGHPFTATLSGCARADWERWTTKRPRLPSRLADTNSSCRTHRGSLQAPYPCPASLYPSAENGVVTRTRA